MTQPSYTDGRTLSALFRNSCHAPILASILSRLKWQDVVRSNLISKHLHKVTASSPELQLMVKPHYHGIPPTFITPTTSNGRQLRELLAREYLLQRLVPLRVDSLSVEAYRDAQLSGDWLLLPEEGKGNVDPRTGKEEVRGFSLWNLPVRPQTPGLGVSSEADEDLERSLLCRVGWEERIHAVVFSAEENLLVIATEMSSTDHVHSNHITVYQISFYTLDGGRSVTGDGKWTWLREPHPNATLATINIGTGMTHSTVTLRMGPVGSGEIIVGLHTPQGMTEEIWSIWNWHAGNCLGRTRSYAHVSLSTIGRLPSHTTSAAYLDPTHIIYTTHQGSPRIMCICVSNVLSRAHAVPISHNLSFFVATGDPLAGWLMDSIPLLPIAAKFHLGDLTRFVGLGEADPEDGPTEYFDVESSSITTTPAVVGYEGGVIALEVVGEVATHAHATAWPAACRFTILQRDIMKAMRDGYRDFQPEDCFDFVRVDCTDAPESFFRSHGARTVTFTPDDRLVDLENPGDEIEFGDTVEFADYSSFGGTINDDTSSILRAGNASRSPQAPAQQSLVSPTDDDDDSPCIFNHSTSSRDAGFGNDLSSLKGPLSGRRLRRAVKAEMQIPEGDVNNVLFDGKRLIVCTTNSLTVFSFV